MRVLQNHYTEKVKYDFNVALMPLWHFLLWSQQGPCVNTAAATALLSKCIRARLFEPAAAIASGLAAHLHPAAAAPPGGPDDASKPPPVEALASVCDALTAEARRGGATAEALLASAWPLLHCSAVDSVLSGSRRPVQPGGPADPVRQAIEAVAQAALESAPAALPAAGAARRDASAPLGLLGALPPGLRDAAAAAAATALASLSADAQRALSGSAAGRALAAAGAPLEIIAGSSAAFLWAHLPAPGDAMLLRAALWQGPDGAAAAALLCAHGRGAAEAARLAAAASAAACAPGSTPAEAETAAVLAERLLWRLFRSDEDGSAGEGAGTVPRAPALVAGDGAAVGGERAARPELFALAALVEAAATAQATDGRLAAEPGSAVAVAAADARAAALRCALSDLPPAARALTRVAVRL